jgi:hypothetical protein
MVDEQTRRRSSAGDGNTHLHTAIGGRPPQFMCDRACLAEQPLEPAQIERDLTRAADLDPRRELARNALEHRAIGSLRTVQDTKHVVSPRADLNSRPDL